MSCHMSLALSSVLIKDRPIEITTAMEWFTVRLGWETVLVSAGRRHASPAVMLVVRKRHKCCLGGGRRTEGPRDGAPLVSAQLWRTVSCSTSTVQAHGTSTQGKESSSMSE